MCVFLFTLSQTSTRNHPICQPQQLQEKAAECFSRVGKPHLVNVMLVDDFVEAGVEIVEKLHDLNGRRGGRERREPHDVCKTLSISFTRGTRGCGVDDGQGEGVLIECSGSASNTRLRRSGCLNIRSAVTWLIWPVDVQSLHLRSRW